MNNRLKFKQIFSSILQQPCILCASHRGGDDGLCNDCLQNLPWHTAPKCPQCGLLSDGLICGHCLQSSPSFDATHALFSYDYPLDRLLQHYKYKESLHLADTFASLFTKRLLDVAANKHTQTDLIITNDSNSAGLIRHWK